MTLHTFASAGELPHAASTILSNRFFLNNQYYLFTPKKIVAVLEENQEEGWKDKTISPYITKLNKNVGTGTEQHFIVAFCFPEVQIADFSLTHLVENMLFYSQVMDII